MNEFRKLESRAQVPSVAPAMQILTVAGNTFRQARMVANLLEGLSKGVTPCNSLKLGDKWTLTFPELELKINFVIRLPREEL